MKMTRMRSLIQARRRRGDEGMALIMVIGIGSVIGILIVAALASAVGGMKMARADQDWNAAMAAAYAGIEEYQSRLANDPAYYLYGNPASLYAAAAGNDVTLPTGSGDNPAFGVGATGSWATVPGSGGEARFRYEVDNSDYSKNGNIHIRATGLVGGESRSIVADLKQKGFVDYLYFTDYEILDPDVSSSSCDPRHAWAVAGSRSPCTEIQFGSFDVLNGPVHSNDTLQLCGNFFGEITSSRPTAPFYTTSSGCGGSPFFHLTPPEYSAELEIPPTNSQHRKETRSDVPGQVASPGCLYTGPTTIELHGDGTMTVRSPWTKATNIAGDPATSGSAPARCGTPGAGGLGSASGQRIGVPQNNVVFVQNIPLDRPADPNYASAADAPSTGICKDPAGAAVVGNGHGYPLATEQAPSSAYQCRNGDVFIKGTLAGSMTVSAENYIYVVGDIRYNDPEEDILGLVGSNAVWVWNPIASNGTNLTAPGDRRIDAAILSVAHTFMVQNYNRGDTRGTLVVNGAIAQKFRGTVATLSGSGIQTGYMKDYVYDPRLKYAAPPKFLSPVATSYSITVWIEVSPVFDTTGDYRQAYQ